MQAYFNIHSFSIFLPGCSSPSEPPSLSISWVNPFTSRFINRTIFLCNALESHECACCLLSFLYFHWLYQLLYQRAKPPQGIVLFINLLGKGLTPRACMGDAGSIWWVPAGCLAATLNLWNIGRLGKGMAGPKTDEEKGRSLIRSHCQSNKEEIKSFPQ